ncbi:MULTISPECIES: transcription factor FapR [Staphylococcus]|uniref:transcription factor FapR n=1 Tax=Staphylococcus TaxID=1279 RepID=UPI0008A3E2A7|nr:MULTISPECIES: transcription factor FapR [Staphylococcus]ARB77999.1 transcription factor FapR [Staphylococcus lugdunensis]ARJ19119.1 fatty acid biosynthesis transcriptional regulator [Staphylococcus lugdunensis]MBM7133310.1 transcription factor FapR [Staphylococcus lugdunensis]MCH8641704.1 transcription factor FapR [Staphylococcus lugdunensis]MCH8643486.1 transcription factor FapR [Staphylococcus lugdunensis]
MKLKKNERRIAIQQAIEHNPFITDHELCEQFSVSIQTIRLDRTHLKIPELRKRIKLVAEQNYQHLQSLEANEIFGDIIKMNPNIEAESIIHIASDSVFSKNNIARGHILFAQANSLCVALIHKPTALTSESNVTFVEKVKLNDTVGARAKVVKHSENYYHIDVTSYVKEILVFKGHFKMFYISEDEYNG